MFSLSTHSAIDEIPAADWNRLAGMDAPFLRHEFLVAQERHGCVGPQLGWVPQHLALRDERGALVAVAPCYLKSNSYGEFVFDWAWADAYARAGLRYYPKLVVASPYTPATGARILTGDDPRRPDYAAALLRGAVELAQRLGVSSLHWLFTAEDETAWAQQQGLMRRLGCQFHWHNAGYGSFDDFLGAFSAPKRKNVKRERRRVAEAGIRFRRLLGSEVSAAEWELFHRLYCDTFDKRGGYPTLTLPFFREIGRTMGEQMLLVLAYQGHRPGGGGLQPARQPYPLRAALGLLRRLPQPALRGLLLSGPGLLHPPGSGALRARGPGRAQGEPRLPADTDLVRPLD